MNWTDLGIPSLIVVISGGLFFWHNRIVQSTIKKLETENLTLNSVINRLEKKLSSVAQQGIQTNLEESSVHKVVEFQAPPTGEYNHPFYEYFIQQITNAKKNIVITGDGFECVNEQGREVANKFIGAFRTALNNGVTVVRIETKSRGRIEWANMLAGLVGDYGDKFSLYILREKKSTQMASVCVIDPEVLNSSTVEIMLSTMQLLGIKAGDLAGTAVFLHGQPFLAQDLRKRIISLTDSEYTVNPITPTEVVNILAGEDYYFSFGSNMKTEQMVDRCPSAVKIGVGVLQDHEIVFNREGSYRQGGVASVQQLDGGRVYGVIWKLNPSEFVELDKSEDLTAYRRFEDNIKRLDGKMYRSHIYKAIPQGSFDPDPDYLDLMIDAGNEQGLPNKYIEYLESFRESA